jgi:hypothetical protein
MQRMKRTRAVEAALTMAVVLGGAASSPAGTLPPRVTVESQSRKDHLLMVMAANLVMIAGLNRALVDRALVGVERHVERRLKAGQPVVLYPEVVTSITRAALLHGWSGAEVAGVLVDVLKMIDDEGRSPEMTRRAAMVAITGNLKPVAVVTALRGPADPRE